MLESVFLILIIMGFILFLVSIYEESVILNLMVAASWIVITAASLYIEVPGATDTYMEMTINAFSFLFVIVSIVFAIKNFMKPPKEQE